MFLKSIPVEMAFKLLNILLLTMVSVFLQLDKMARIIIKAAFFLFNICKLLILKIWFFFKIKKQRVLPRCFKFK